MTTSTAEKSHLKYSWILVVAGGLLGLPAFYSPPGRTVGPLDFVFGPLVGAMGLVQLFVGLTAFRKRMKWGWYLVLLAWLVALVNGIYDSVVASPNTGISTFLFFGGPALLALLISFRKFYPKK